MDKAGVMTTTTMAPEGDALETATRKDGFFRHSRSLVYCGVVCLGGFQLGLDLGSVTGMQAMPGFLMMFGFRSDTSALGWNIDPTVQRLIGSLVNVGSLFAGFAVGPMGKYLTRKWILFVGCCINQVGAILMIVAKDFATLYAGRFIIGLAIGFLDVVPQLYIHECAPAVQRGPLLGAFNIMIGVGLLTGSIVNNYTAKIMNHWSYIIPLITFFIVPTILAVCLLFMPETPRWLIERNQPEKAKRALARLRHRDTSTETLDAELEVMRLAFEAEKALTDGAGFLDCFRKTNLRRTLLSLALLTSLGGSGALFFLIFGTYFFAIAGQTKAFEETVGMTAAGLGATLFSLWLVTKVGRRTILLIGYAAQAVCMLIVALVYQYLGTSQVGGRVLVAFTIIFLVFYNMCVAPYMYLCAGEIPTQRLRGHTLGMAIGVAFFWNWLVSYTAPYFLNPAELNWGGKYGYIWFGSNIVVGIFIFFFVPETKDRTLEEIDEMFEEKLDARKFKRYRCTRAESARLASMHLAADKQAEAHEHVESS